MIYPDWLVLSARLLVYMLPSGGQVKISQPVAICTTVIFVTSFRFVIT